MPLRDTINNTPVVDNHAHTVWPLGDLTPAEFAGYFTEGPSVEQARHTINYRTGLQLIAEQFDGETEADLIANRSAVELENYSKELMDEANISHILQDTGFPPDLGPEDFAPYTTATIHPILRIENRAEELIAANDSFAGFEADFQTALESALAEDHVGLKSIAAYRTGLDIRTHSRSEAAKAFVEAKESTETRLEHPVLIDYCAHLAASIAAEYDAPFQFHSGFGDADAHPLYVDPGHLFDFLNHHPDTDVVMLHAGYPYTQKGAYITSVLENAYLDLGMTIPFIQHGVEPLLRQTLELAPTTKLLYSSDGYGIPEWYYLAANRIRTDLATVLEGLVDNDFLTPEYAETAATNILRENAIRIYDL